MTPDKLKLFMHAILKLLLQNLRKMPEEQALFATSIAFWETVTIEQLKDALSVAALGSRRQPKKDLGLHHLE